VSSLVQGGYRIDVEIHTERMTELIGDELRIDAGLSGETRVSAAHDLKGASGSAAGLRWRHWNINVRVLEDKATLRFERSLLGWSSLPR